MSGPDTGETVSAKEWLARIQLLAEQLQTQAEQLLEEIRAERGKLEGTRGDER